MREMHADGQVFGSGLRGVETKVLSESRLVRLKDCYKKASGDGDNDSEPRH